MTHRWPTRYSSSGGIDMIVEAAIIAPQKVWSATWNEVRPTGAVMNSLFWTRTSAYRNSFHESVNENTATTTIAGAESGTMMRQSTIHLVAPSTSAASSSSIGTVRKYPI